MSFSDAVRSCFVKYGNFGGRATRSEFWWFYLFTLIVGMVIDGLAYVTEWSALSAVGNLVSLAFLMPSVAVAGRRLHDIGRSGWWQLLSLTVVGVILLIYWWAQPSQPGSNDFGDPPA